MGFGVWHSWIYPEILENEGNVDGCNAYHDTQLTMASEQGLAAKSGTATPNLGIDPRREKRLHLAIPVKVFADPASQDFQTCCTYELSIIGVRLVAPIGITKVGQIIALQRHNRRARYRVVWIGHPDTKEAGQVGVESLEPNNVIWESEIRTKLGKS